MEYQKAGHTLRRYFTVIRMGIHQSSLELIFFVVQQSCDVADMVRGMAVLKGTQVFYGPLGGFGGTNFVYTT